MARILSPAAALTAMTAALTIAPIGLGSAHAAPAMPQFARPTVPLQASVPAAANQIAAADFNGDGLVDVLIARLGSVSTDTFPVTVLLNKGNGRFVDATKSIFVGTKRVKRRVDDGFPAPTAAFRFSRAGRVEGGFAHPESTESFRERPRAPRRGP